jgi:hypothetical protein
MTAFEFNLIGKHDLTKYLAGQPVRLMSRVIPKEGTTDTAGGNPHAWNIEVWNEKQVASLRKNEAGNKI